ncbi:SCO2521 family protein [Rugosimonospora acidiphila]|uniref:SCO2521 family protein n=2 Tax=Rugosimonospora acidiphila TaxID=556531 RepID=A0ABP9SH76_9ACTN
MLRRDQPVRWSSRPIAYAVTQDLLTGVDCRLPAAGSGTRCVGTVRSHAALTGGRVLQGSAHVAVARSEHNRRLPWSHYLSRPGVVETIGTERLPEVVAGFSGSPQQSGSLDLGSIGTRVMNTVQDSPQFDGRLPFRMARTTLRWIVAPTDLRLPDTATVQFTVDGEVRRILVLRLDLDLAEEALEQVVALCEDLALHDWLLTALEQLIERSQIGSGPPVQVVERLKPAIDQLLHLWMPAARIHPELMELWQSLERRPGFTRQWRAGVDRVRDQLTANTIALLSSARLESLRP